MTDDLELRVTVLWLSYLSLYRFRKFESEVPYLRKIIAVNCLGFILCDNRWSNIL